MSDVHDGDDTRTEAMGAEPPDPRTSESFWIEALGGGRVGRTIVGDREVRAAIAGGRYRALYKLLRKRRKTARSREETAALDELLARRRAFLEPVEHAPDAISWWGFGTNLQGRQDPDPEDGTYITTHFLTALGMPLWPLKHYLVADDEDGGWHVLGRVPMSPKVRLWRAGAALGALALAVFIGWMVWRAGTHDDVHVVNALPESVVVSIGDQRIPVAAGGRSMREIPSGKHEVVVTAEDGRELERATIEVDGGHDLAVYNVLGAAPLYVEEFGYGDVTLGRRMAGGVSYRLHAGDRWVTRDSLEHVFETEPDEVQVDRGKKGETRLVAKVHGGGLRVSLSGLEASGRMDEARALADRVYEACPAAWQAGMFRCEHAERTEGPEAAGALVDAWLARDPGSVHAHRLRQARGLERGERTDLIRTYRAAFEAAPDDPDKAYLLARLLPPGEARALAAPFVGAHPDNAWLRRVLAWNAFVEADHAAAAPHYGALQRLVPHEEGEHLLLHVRCLAALGREAEALGRLRAFLEGLDERRARVGESHAGATWLQTFGLYALLRWRLPEGRDHPTVLALLRPQLEAGFDEKLMLAMIAGWARSEEHLRRFTRDLDADEVRVAQARLEVLSKRDPDAAVAAVAAASPEVRGGIDYEATMAIVAAFARAGRLDEVGDLLEGLAAGSDGDLDGARFAGLPSLEGLDPDFAGDFRAALLLAASHAATDPAERARLLAEARRHDPLRRLVP